MAMNLIVVLAASGLVAAAPVATQTRASDVTLASKTALVQAAAVKPVGAACFVPVQKGKLMTLADLRKAKATGQCGNTQLAPIGTGPLAGLSTTNAVVLGGVVATMIAIPVVTQVCTASGTKSGC